MTKKNMEFYWLPLVAALSALLSLSGYAQEAESKLKNPLTKKVNRLVVDKIIPAIRQQDDLAFLQLSMPLIKSNKPEQLEVIDQMCLDRSVATVTQRFTDLVIKQMQQGIDVGVATKSRGMSRVVLYGLADELDQFGESITTHDALQDPLEVPADFQESEKLFWDIHVLHNEFDNVTHKLQLASSLMKKHKKALKKQDGNNDLLARFTEIENRLKAQYKNIDERAAELRLQRLKVAYQALTNQDNDDNFELLLTSAMALEQDSQVLTAFFKENDSISREALVDINLPGEVTGMLAAGRKAHEDVTKKANLFRNGLHYWVRGRYGAGPLTAGLVKAPQAMDSLEAMELLSMPRVRDKPISSYHSEEETTRGYDRRHYYTWAAEYRPMRVRQGKKTSETELLSSTVSDVSYKNEQDFI